MPEKDLRRHLEQWLPAHLPLSAEMGEVVIERAHRLGPYRSGEQRPRAVIARFLNAAQKDGVLRASRQLKRSGATACKVLIFQDYSAEVSLQRKAFQDTCRKLIDRGVRFTLAYPATLRVFSEGGNRVFSSPEETRDFCNGLG